MLTLELENKEIELKIKEFIKDKHIKLEDFALNAFTSFISKFEENEIKIIKRDPMKYMKIIGDEYDSKEFTEEELKDVNPYKNIENSAKYVKNLRSKRRF